MDSAPAATDRQPEDKLSKAILRQEDGIAGPVALAMNAAAGTDAPWAAAQNDIPNDQAFAAASATI